MNYQQINLFDAIRHEDMPKIEVGDICELLPRQENTEYYENNYPQMVGREVRVTALELNNANAIKCAAWIERNGVHTCCYFDDLKIVQKAR